MLRSRALVSYLPIRPRLFSSPGALSGTSPPRGGVQYSKYLRPCRTPQTSSARNPFESQKRENVRRRRRVGDPKQTTGHRAKKEWAQRGKQSSRRDWNCVRWREKKICLLVKRQRSTGGHSKNSRGGWETDFSGRAVATCCRSQILRRGGPRACRAAEGRSSVKLGSQTRKVARCTVRQTHDKAKRGGCGFRGATTILVSRSIKEAGETTRMSQTSGGNLPLNLNNRSIGA